MTRRALHAWVAGTPLLLLALTACTAGAGDRARATDPRSPTSPPVGPAAQAAVTDDSDITWNGLAASMGGTATFDSGLAVRVATPVRWTVATGGTVDSQRTLFTVAVTVTNGQSTSFDAGGLTADAVLGATGTPCTKAQDSSRGLGRPIPASVPAGGTSRITLGYSCPGRSGQAVLVEVVPQPGFAGAQFSGSLP